MTNSEIHLSVVRGDRDILEELFKNLAKTEATQIFVTGREAYRTLADRVDSISAVLGQTWTVLPCWVAPTQADMRSLMEEFASAIDGAPSQRRICFGPTSPEKLLKHLFGPSQNGFYKAGLYILGLCDSPIGDLVQFGKAINAEGKAPGFLESIISAEDNGLLISEQQELRTLLEQGGDVRDKLWKIMASRQEQVEAEEKALREPLPPDVLTTIAEAERRKRGLLPPPQNIAFNYECECGDYLSVDLKNFNIFGGIQVTCAHCGAVCFVPPEILDHTRYDPSRKGATLRGDYQSLLSFVRHRLNTTQDAEKRVVTVLPIPRDAVEHPSDVTRDKLERLVGGFAATCVKEGQLRKISLTISGYDSDPRELYEIPELCAWARDTFKSLPSLWFFLDDDSRDRFIGWLCGPVARKDIQSRDFLQRLNNKRMECVVASYAASSDFLERAGAGKEMVSSFYFQEMNKRATQHR